MDSLEVVLLPGTEQGTAESGQGQGQGPTSSSLIGNTTDFSELHHYVYDTDWEIEVQYRCYSPAIRTQGCNNIYNNVFNNKYP
jgi:hypothetical protein